MTACVPRVERTYLPVPQSDAQIPVITLTGAEGPVCTITAGVHANEYVGEQALVELAHELAAAALAGTVRLVPVANVCGFGRRGTSMVPPAEENLNRVFPGSPTGTLGERVAWTVFNGCIASSDFYVDLHSGDYFEDLAPHLYYVNDLPCSAVAAQMARCANVPFSAPFGGARSGNAIASAAAAGVPSVLVERGGMGRWTRAEVEGAKADVRNLLRFMGILEGEALDFGTSQLCFADERLVDFAAPCSGLWYPAKRPGEGFAAGESLGQVRDVFGSVLYDVNPGCAGYVIFQTGALNAIEGGPLITYGVLA